MAERGRWAFDGLIDQVRDVCEITENGCWLWRFGSWAGREAPGADEAQRYPRLMIGGVRKHVTDWVLEAGGRPQPPGTEACHSCDDTRCVFTGHLRWGTHRSNMEEMMRRGRNGQARHPEQYYWRDDHALRLHPERIARGPRPGNYASGDDHYTRRNPEQITWKGEAHYRARLDPGQVREIRARGAAGERAAQIAGDLGVGRGTVRAILEGRTWKHVR